MLHTKLTLVSRADGTVLSVLSTRPAEKVRGTVQLLHGMTEHKERYLPLMEFLTEHGFVCITHDHRGHGESVAAAEDLGYFGKNGGAKLVADCRQVGEWIEAQDPDVPHFLFGHSMGSLAARVYLKQWDDHFSGAVIVGSPSNNPARAVGDFLLAAAELFVGGHRRSAVFDRLIMGSNEGAFADEGRGAWLTTDPERLAEYRADKLCKFEFTVSGYRGLLWLMKETYRRAGWQVKNPGLPVRFLSGGDDPCRISDEKFFDAAETMRRPGYRNVTARLFPGMRHEIHGERDKQIVWDDILAFFTQECVF